MEQVTDPGVLWLAGAMGTCLLGIVAVFLHQFYTSTNSFIAEVRQFNASTREKIDGVVDDVSEIKKAQNEQNRWIGKIGERVAKVETKIDKL